MQCFDFNRALRNMTIASLTDIRRFTPEGVYEIIVVDNTPKFPLRDGYEVLNIEKYIEQKQYDLGCFASYNKGAVIAEGDVLVFIQNDVFVREGWLSAMRYYIDNNLADVVYPDQVPRNRKSVEKSYSLRPEEAMFGGRDAGMMMITKEGFDKTGGWDKRIKASVIGWKQMFRSIDKAGLRWTDTCKTFITHIAGGTNWMKSDEQFSKECNEEAEILKEYDT